MTQSNEMLRLLRMALNEQVPTEEQCVDILDKFDAMDESTRRLTIFYVLGELKHQNHLENIINNLEKIRHDLHDEERIKREDDRVLKRWLFKLSSSSMFIITIAIILSIVIVDRIKGENSFLNDTIKIFRTIFGV